MKKKKGVFSISRWVNDKTKGGYYWKCEMCGGGLHHWSILEEVPQWVQCPDCKAIMLNKEVISKCEK